jgi:hypothetical protein
MKSLLQTHSISFAESVRIALEAKGISAVLLDEQSASSLSFAGRIRVAIHNDAEYGRAMRIVRQLEPSPTPPLPSWRWQKPGLIGLFVGALTMAVSGQMTDVRYAWVAVGVSGVMVVGGIAMIAIGFRADRGAGSGAKDARGPD